MAILTSTEYRTKDMGITRDVDFCFSNVRPGVEEGALVALACTEHVAGHGVSGNLFQRTRHAECTTRHVDGTLTGSSNRNERLIIVITIFVIITHIGMFITAIDTGQNMSAKDIHHGIATDRTRLSVPFARLIRIESRAATEHVTKEGMSVGSDVSSASG